VAGGIEKRVVCIEFQLLQDKNVLDLLHKQGGVDATMYTLFKK
jgi:hypothetical protein